MIEFHNCDVLASFTVGRTGNPKCSPLFPGVTPPTMLVPHSIDSLALAVALIEYEDQHGNHK